MGGNTGLYSHAVDISPLRYQLACKIKGFSLFIDCNILVNLHDNHTKTTYRGRSKFHITQGVFVIPCFSVYFQGFLTFQNNSYSALYLTSGWAVFRRNSMIVFNGNVGINGGGISAHGFSTISVNDNSHFYFINNSAINHLHGISVYMLFCLCWSL